VNYALTLSNALIAKGNIKWIVMLAIFRNTISTMNVILRSIKSFVKKEANQFA